MRISDWSSDVCSSDLGSPASVDPSRESEGDGLQQCRLAGLVAAHHDVEPWRGAHLEVAEDPLALHEDALDQLVLVSYSGARPDSLVSHALEMPQVRQPFEVRGVIINVFKRLRFQLDFPT